MTKTKPDPLPLDPSPFDPRIKFDTDHQIMEIDFRGLILDDTASVNALYDRIEERIAQTGEELWFFLINYSQSRIDQSAWLAYSRRGKALNMGHSMGTVRFDASEETRQQILRSANTDAFDANLFASRDDAIERLQSLPSKRRKRVQHDPNHTLADFVRRLSFDASVPLMEADFSHFTFHHTRDVDDFYDYIEERIKESDRKWFFLVNMEGCEIMPAAWVRYAYRGKRLNQAASLGSVRYAPDSETEADIRLRAETQGFRPNIRNTRSEALQRIAEMKSEIVQG